MRLRVEVRARTEATTEVVADELADVVERVGVQRLSAWERVGIDGDRHTFECEVAA